jgi:phage tail-like protein
MERLTVRLEERSVYSSELSDETLTIGRTPDNTVVLEHTLVSRHHAELRRTAQGLLLTDLGSTNGTFVDGTRLLPNQPFLLLEGQISAIGPFQVSWQTVSVEEARTVIEPQAPQAPNDEQPAVPPEGALVQAFHAEGSGSPTPIAEVPARPAFPMPIAAGPRCQYLRDLPMIFEDDDFFNRFLLIFETLWEPLERRQDQIAMYFDPHTCPAEMLPWLGTWLDLELNPHWPEIRQRHLLSEAVELYRWRGTRYGLSRLLEISTGIVPTILEPPDQPFFMNILVPIAAEETEQRELIERLIHTHKPAHVGYTLRFS